MVEGALHVGSGSIYGCLGGVSGVEGLGKTGYILDRVQESIIG